MMLIDSTSSEVCQIMLIESTSSDVIWQRKKNIIFERSAGEQNQNKMMIFKIVNLLISSKLLWSNLPAKEECENTKCMMHLT